MSAPEPELPQMCTVSLPPFGLPPISSRREKKSPQVDPLTQKPERDNVWFEDARLLCKVLNIIDDLELWHAVALYRMSHGRITSPYMTVINCHSNLTMYKKWLDSQGGFFVSERAVSELYRLVSDVAKISKSYREFVVSIVKHLSRTATWATKGVSDALLVEIRKRVVHRGELEEIRSDIASGRGNPLKEHWSEIVLGAMSAYGEKDVSDRVVEEMKASASKKIKVNLDDLDLAVGSYSQGAGMLNLGSDSKLESLRMTCMSIIQLGLDMVNLVDLYMNEGHYAARDVMQERRNPCYQDENDAYYLENHLNTWIEEFQINNPTEWDQDPRVLVLEELEGMLSCETIDQSALEADNNE